MDPMGYKKPFSINVRHVLPLKPRKHLLTKDELMTYGSPHHEIVKHVLLPEKEFRTFRFWTIYPETNTAMKNHHLSWYK